jgi:TolB-like protein/DNA-binding winged helix-turn-helix (wHTH) protein/rhodanese-related sulfurtransferase/Tfp pilus assembly protein PilF
MSESLEIYAFGEFVLDPAHRSLTGPAGPVTLSSRAFDILVLLAEHRERVVTKDEILRVVWRGTIVEENNLAVQISALRRALNPGGAGPSAIATIPGKGYRFVGQLEQPSARPAKDTDPQAYQPGPAAILPPAPAEPFEPPSKRAWWVIPAGLVGLLAALGLGLATLHHAAAPPPAANAEPPSLSLAVLPFRNLSGTSADDYLADAISDDLTTDLSHIPGSTVIARESSDMYRGHNQPTPEIGRALNVRYLLEGSLRRTEGRFSINAQLIEAATQGHVWAQRFAVPLDHLAEAQESIVRQLASALGVTLVDVEGQRSLREHGANPGAVDLFLRARSILDRSDTLESLTQAQALLEKAAAIEPDNADVASALGWLLLRKIRSFDDPSETEDHAEARRMVAKAMALAPNGPASLADQGLLLYADDKIDAARASYQAALSLDGNNVDARSGLALSLEHLARFPEAMQALAELLRIDPQSRRTKSWYYHMGFDSLMLGNPREALAWLIKSEAGDSDPRAGANRMGRVEWAKWLEIAASEQIGDHAGAKALYARAAAVWPNRTAWHLSTQMTHAQSLLPGNKLLFSALTAAGMPEYPPDTVDQRQAQVTPPASGAQPHGEFDLSPASIPGVNTIDTKALAAMMAAGAPLIVDVGEGAATPHGSLVTDMDPFSADEVARLKTSLPADGRPVVIMGNSAFGWKSYALASALHAAGMANIAWYRGGEEAWVRAGMPSEDRRSP